MQPVYFAQTITVIINKIKDEIINPTIALLFSAATVVFVWGIIQYIAASGSPAAAQKGKSIMIGGIIGMFVMASAWGIVKMFCDFFGTSC
jgi:uncharacterized membrane protein